MERVVAEKPEGRGRPRLPRLRRVHHRLFLISGKTTGPSLPKGESAESRNPEKECQLLSQTQSPPKEVIGRIPNLKGVCGRMKKQTLKRLNDSRNSKTLNAEAVAKALPLDRITGSQNSKTRPKPYSCRLSGRLPAQKGSMP